MNDVRPQLEMHEQILNKYKKILFENNQENKQSENKLINNFRAQSLDSSFKENNINSDKNPEKSLTFTDSQRNMSQIDILKSKYLNKLPSQNNVITYNNRLDHINLKTFNFNESVLNKYQNNLQINMCKPNDGIEMLSTISNREAKNDNIIESLKSKYLNRANTNSINPNKDIFSKRAVSNNSEQFVNTERKFLSDPLFIKTNSPLVKIDVKSENILDRFLQKYSDEKINKEFEKRINDIKLSPNKKFHAHTTEEQGLKIIPNLSINNNLLDTSSLETLKILQNQSNIKYNISNESVLSVNNNNNTNIRFSYEEEDLKVENNINNSLEFSNFDKNSENSSYKNQSYQIENINDIIASSSKIIENYEKTKNNLIENLNEIVEKTTEKMIEKEKISARNKDDLEIIEQEIIPISKRLENLKNLKNNIDNDLKKNIHKKIPKVEEKVNKENEEIIERNDYKIEMNKQRVDLIKIPKFKNPVNKYNKEEIQIKNNCNQQNFCNLNEIMNNLLHETINKLFIEEKTRITQMDRSEFDLEKNDEKDLEIHSQVNIKSNISNSKNPISFITTRSKTLPKKNLCSFDNFIKENK